MDVVVARIGKAHALRGEVTVETRTDDPRERFVVGATFATQARPGSGVPRQLTLRSARVHNGIWLLAFDEIPDRTGAESLRGTLLLADVDDAPGEDDGYYEVDLVGLRVEDPAGAVLGEVTGLDARPAQDLLQVRLTDGREGLVPFVEAIVPEVDLDGGRIVVDAPEGLYDLWEA